MAFPADDGIAVGISEPETITLGNDGDLPTVAIEFDSDTIPTLEPESLRGERTEEPRRGRRGRPAGSKNRTVKAEKQTASNLENLLYSIHLMGSQLLKIDELALTQQESQKLGEALAQVNRVYGNVMLTEKQEALLNLASVAGVVYVPRFWHYKQRMKEESKKKPVLIKPDTQNVVTNIVP